MIEQMRINTRILVGALVIIALVAVAVIFLMQWLSVKDEQTKLEHDLKTAEVQLVQANQDYDVARLVAEEAVLKSQAEFPDELRVRDLSGFLARGAPLNQVTITAVTPPSKIGTQAIGGRNYPAYATKMTVTGSLTKIISYLRYIESGTFRSVKVQDLSLEGSGESWTGKFTVVVISQG